jgi:hypothetical protein
MLDPQNAQNAENVLVPLAGVLLICLGIVLITYLIVKITRQGGAGTLVIWLLLSGLSGLLATILITVVGTVQVKLGTGELGLTGGVLKVYWGAFTGCLMQGLWGGIIAERTKGKPKK